MSDPMTKQTADEVLASIRRLVSETHGESAFETDMPAKEALTEALNAAVRSPVSQSHSEAATPLELKRARPDASEPPSDDGALILSPSFRVSNGGHSEPNAASSEPDENAAEVAAPAEPLVLSLDQAVHLPEAAETSEPVAEVDEAETATLEALIAEEIDLAQDYVAKAAQETSDGAVDWSASLDDTPDAEAAAHVADLSLEQRIAELEAAVGAQSYEWEPDGSEDLAEEIPQAMPRAFTEAGARVLHFRARQEDMPEMTEARDDSVTIEDADVTDETLSAMDGAVDDGTVSEAAPTSEFATAEIEDAEIEDAEIVEDVEAAAPLPTFDDVNETHQTDDAIAPDTEPNLEEELALAGYADEDIMDEEALRDLVAQVIREELQGELGQRITRNVRLLVRREVQRALSLREFE